MPKQKAKLKSLNKPKLQYDVVLTKGKSARALQRLKAKKFKEGGITSSPLGKMRPRQERKAMAKSLGIPFNPKYNGPVYKYVPVEDAEGNLTIQLVEVN